MQSTWAKDQEPRGFAGLAALGIPVEDLLTDLAVPAPAGNQVRFGNDTDSAATPAAARGSGGVWFGWLCLGVVSALLVVAMIVWRGDNLPTDGSASNDGETAAVKQPSQGNAQLLSRAEIRYCLSEEMRLQAARDVVATQAVDVRRLNASVADLNARCASFQYQGDDLALAEADVLARADAIRADGQTAFLLPTEPAEEASLSEADSVAAGAPQRGVDQTPIATASAQTGNAEPSDLVRDVQWLLFKLNYYDGEMSGLDTLETQAARARFLDAMAEPQSTDFATTLLLLNDAVARGETTDEEASESPENEQSTDDAVQADSVQTPLDTEPAAVNALPNAVAEALLRLADADRLAIVQLCRSRADSNYSGCVDGQLEALQLAPNVALTPLSDEERRLVLSTCGPLRATEGPAAFYVCKAEQAGLAVKLTNQNVVESAGLPQSVVTVIESRCEPFEAAAAGEHARCVTGQFANLSDALNPVFIKQVDFTERASIESMCSSGSTVFDIANFYGCVSDELEALDRVGPKPDMRVASFAHRKDIEAACQQDRLSRGPSAYYRCLQTELTARGY